MTSRMQSAERAYREAQDADTPEAWRKAAELLYRLRAPAKPAGKPRKVRCRYPFPVARATFADGVVIRRTFYSANGKPLDWARAERIAARGYAFETWARKHEASERILAMRQAWRQRVRAGGGNDYELRPNARPVPLFRIEPTMARVNVPPLLSLIEETTGERRRPELREVA